MLTQRHPDGRDLMSGEPARRNRDAAGVLLKSRADLLPRWSQAMFVAILSLAIGAGFGIQDAIAQPTFPSHPITMIVPFAAGGTTDVVARVVGASMSRVLGQQIIFENVIGGGGTTAATRAMRATPDGYTIILGHMGTHGSVVALYPHLAYNPAVDFAPIGVLTSSSVFIVARKDTGAATLREFIAHESPRNGEISMAHAGVGSVSHVACQLFNSVAGLKPKLVPFQGSDPAIKALAAGKVDYMCDQAISVVPQALAKNIQVFAVASPHRNPALPDVPTAAEAGLPAFDVVAWTGLFAPRETPPAIVARLNEAMNTALDDPSVRKQLIDLGSEIPDRPARTAQALAEKVKFEIAKWIPFFSPESVTQ